MLALNAALARFTGITSIIEWHEATAHEHSFPKRYVGRTGDEHALATIEVDDPGGESGIGRTRSDDRSAEASRTCGCDFNVSLCSY
jgi:hypothetical protein